MKTKMDRTTLGILVVGIVWLSGMTGCSLSDDEFSDIRWIEKAINEDKEEVYGVQVVDDQGAQDIDTTGARGLEVFGKTFLLDGNSSNTGPRLGRVIQNRYRERYIEILDTVAFALVRDSLVGKFWSVKPTGTIIKDLRHVFWRVATFVKREEVESYGGWVRVSVSPSVGFSTGSTVFLDSVIITTPRDTIVTTSPRDLLFGDDRILKLQRGDVVDIHIRAFDLRPGQMESLFSTILVGRNQLNTPGRNRFYMFPLGNGMYRRQFTVGQEQENRIHHLVVDLLDRNSFNRVDPLEFPYNSFMAVIPYRVVEPPAGGR